MFLPPLDRQALDERDDRVEVRDRAVEVAIPSRLLRFEREAVLTEETPDGGLDQPEKHPHQPVPEPERGERRA